MKLILKCNSKGNKAERRQGNQSHVILKRPRKMKGEETLVIYKRVNALQQDLYDCNRERSVLSLLCDKICEKWCYPRNKSITMSRDRR